MKWENLQKSKNIIDKRKIPHKPLIAVITGTVFAITTLFVYGPTLPTSITNLIPDKDKIIPINYDATKHSDFISTMLKISEDEWSKIFKNNNIEWKNPKLVLFTDKIKTKCGEMNYNFGPFYCAADTTIYIDLDFLTAMSNNLKVIGDASQAYIVFHEVGHHVQYLTGILQTVHKAKSKMSEVISNKLSVQLELQADCYAGIMFNRSKSILDKGDIAEFTNAAARVGDDWLQSRVGAVMPDTFAHGTSEQRTNAILVGYLNGDVTKCDTFK